MTRIFFLMILMITVCLTPVAAVEIPFNASLAGDRNLGQLYTWTVHNASGYSDCVYHNAVYDYREVGENYTYYSPAWGQWFVRDAQPGKKYIAIWIRGWIDGTAWFGYGQERFPLWIWDNMTVYAEPVHMQDVEIGGNGSGRRLPVVIRNLENRTVRSGRGLLTTERYGWKDENELTRIEPGPSNAFDGYALYQIDKRASLADIRVAGWFGYWGLPIWHLETVTVNQESIEKQLMIDAELTKLQRLAGQRMSDKQGGRVRV